MRRQSGRRQADSHWPGGSERGQQLRVDRSLRSGAAGLHFEVHRDRGRQSASFFYILIDRHGVFRGLSLLLPRTHHRVEPRLPRERHPLLGALHHNRE